ncbi:hypothetical protein JCM10212_001890 [Sporobolomyces blumeae]
MSGPSLTYYAKHGRLALPESREFVVETYPLFASLQRIVHEYEASSFGSRTVEPQQVQYYARISGLYRQAILNQLPLIQADPHLSTATKERSLTHHASVHSLLSLAEILYLPLDGTGLSIVSEQLLDWLNSTDRAPSTEAGHELANLATPWDSPEFVPYLTKCVVRGHVESLSALLDLVASTHPAPPVQDLARSLKALVATWPRSTRYATATEFRNALRSYQVESVRAQQDAERAVAALGTGPGLSSSDEVSEWSNAFRTWFSLLALPSTSFSSSASTSSSKLSLVLDHTDSWQEALISFLLLAHPTCTRSELAPILEQIREREVYPVDQTLTEEVVQDRLFRGDITGVLKALTSTSNTGTDGNGEVGMVQDGEEDPEEGNYLWLATHLTDLLSHLALPDFDLPPPPSSSASNLDPRQAFLVAYADTLIDLDPTLWRVCCEYWGECGEVGKERVEKWLVGPDAIALDDDDDDEVEEGDANAGVTDEVDGSLVVVNAGGRMDVDGGAGPSKGAQGAKRKRSSKVEEVLRILGEFGMEEQVQTVCRTYAESLIEKKKYGAAISFCVRAGDVNRIDRVAFEILNEYIKQGQETFVSHVDSLPTSLLRPSSQRTPGLATPPHSPSASSTIDLDQDPSYPSAPTPYPSIAFLSRYRDFLALYTLSNQALSSSPVDAAQGAESSQAHEQMEQERRARLRRQAAELLVLLLTSGVAPKPFWPIMLLDSVGLLETQPPVISLAETYELLRVLEELTAPIDLSASSGSSRGERVDVFGELDMLDRLIRGQGEDAKVRGNRGTDVAKCMEQLEVVREALARHLAICACL